MGHSTEMTFCKEVDAAPTAVYYALTNGAAMREWLSNNSQVATRVGGRIYLYWQQGYYASGEFKELVPNEKVVYSWQGKGDTAVSTVTINLSPTDSGTQVELIHSDLPAGEDTAEMRQTLKESWEAGLANLKSVLETGLDKRIYDQAFLGILINQQLNAEQMAERGLEAEGGISISGTMANTGAAAAGLQANDVIVDMGGNATKDFPSLQAAIRPYRPGDSVKVSYYRDGERQQTLMSLSTRPVPDVPPTAAGLAEALRQAYEQLDKELDEVLAGATEAEAEFRPSEGSWNAKELLGHLITTERGYQMGVATQITDGVLDGFPNNPTPWMQAVTAVYTTLPEIVSLWKRSEAETVALLSLLPDSFVARKTTYLNTGIGFLQGLVGHTRNHIAEIKGLLEAARQA
ncbi:MAG: SRPBCC domain-containing protein [Anaerolineaceae bacterium]|nr:SRPBCC domain-containing protein [Anaerolineaceae bacterium]